MTKVEGRVDSIRRNSSPLNPEAYSLLLSLMKPALLSSFLKGLVERERAG